MSKSENKSFMFKMIIIAEHCSKINCQGSRYFNNGILVSRERSQVRYAGGGSSFVAESDFQFSETRQWCRLLRFNCLHQNTRTKKRYSHVRNLQLGRSLIKTKNMRVWGLLFQQMRFFDRISGTFLIQAFQTSISSSSNGDSQFDSTNSYSDPESSSSEG